MSTSTFPIHGDRVDGGLHRPQPASRAEASRVVVRLAYLLAALASAASATGLLVGGGQGRHEVTTARGEVVTLFGDGLYAADSWLVGAGNRGQDVTMLLVEVPVLLLVLRWYRRGSPVAAVVLAGVLSFFAYYYLAMVFGIAQNRLFPVYVAAASAAGFALVRIARTLNPTCLAAALPAQPGPRTLITYLGGVAAALILAWLPGMLAASISGEVAQAVGPYTSAATEALDLGIVVPLALLAVMLVHRGRPAGRLLALVMLVLNACIGVVLLAQGAAQLSYGVPMTIAELVVKSTTFLVLTLVAGALLASMARPLADRTATRSPRLVNRARRFIGGFYVAMGGVHLGIVTAAPQLYRHFADDALLDLVRDQWAAIVMANPAFWGLLLFAGETVIGMLMLSSRAVAVRAGWCLVIPLARRDWQVGESPRTL